MTVKFVVYRCSVCNRGVIQLSSDRSLSEQPCQVLVPTKCPGTLHKTDEGENLPVDEDPSITSSEPE